MPRKTIVEEPDLLPDDTGEEWEGGETAAVERLEDLATLAPAISVMATVCPLAGRPATTSSGRRGKVRFEVSPDDGRRYLWDAVADESYSLTFEGVALGTGYTVTEVRKRKDADGAERAFIDVAATEGAYHQLGALWDFVGKSGMLVMLQPQTRLDDLLTRRAE